MALLKYFRPAVPGTKVPSLTEGELQEANAGVKEAQERNKSHPQRHGQWQVQRFKICPKKEQLLGRTRLVRIRAACVCLALEF